MNDKEREEFLNNFTNIDDIEIFRINVKNKNI